MPRMRSTGHVAGVEDRRGAYRDLRKRDHSEDERILKRIFKKVNVGTVAQDSDRWWAVVMKLSVSTKCGEIFD